VHNSRLAQAGAEANFQLFQAIFVGSVRTVRAFNALPDASLQPLPVSLKDDSAITSRRLNNKRIKTDKPF
jgi:hypothetical protein